MRVEDWCAERLEVRFAEHPKMKKAFLMRFVARSDIPIPSDLSPCVNTRAGTQLDFIAWISLDTWGLRTKGCELASPMVVTGSSPVIVLSFLLVCEWGVADPRLSIGCPMLLSVPEGDGHRANSAEASPGGAKPG